MIWMRAGSGWKAIRAADIDRRTAVANEQRTPNVCTLAHAMTSEADTRSERWNLRVAQDEDELVREAAELSEEGLTGFIRDAAVQEAKRVLADRQLFLVDEVAMQQFNELLDRPAEGPEGLRKLFSRPSVFDQ